MRRRLSVFVGVVVSLLFLYLAFRNQDLGQIAQQMRKANPLWLLASLVALFTSYFFRSLRWQAIILVAGQRVPYWTVFRLLLIGQAGNCLLPARAGDILRVVLLGRRIGLARSFALGTILAERINDAIAMCLMILISVILLPLPEWVREAQTVGVILLAVGLTGALALGLLRERAVRWATSLFGWVFGIKWGERIGGMVGEFISGLKIFQSPGLALSVVGLTLLGWTCITASLWCAFEALQLGVSPLGAVFVESILQLMSIVPSSSGFVGPYEYFSMKSLELLGVPVAMGLASAVLYHFMWLAMESTLGLLAFAQSETGLRRFWKVTQGDAPPS